MLSNYVAAIGPMTQNAGAFGAAIAGQNDHELRADAERFEGQFRRWTP